MVDVNDHLISLPLERQCLSSLVKYPDIFSEIDSWISDNDFADRDNVHSIIYSVVRKVLLNNEKFDKVLISQEIKNLGVSFKDGEINIFDYINNLYYTQINKESTLKYFKQLKRLSILRELDSTALQIRQIIRQQKNKDLDEIVSLCDQTYNDKIDTYRFEEEPKDLFEDLIEVIEETGKNPTKETGLITGYKDFNRLMGGLRHSNGIYSVVSRPGIGKSSWLLNLAVDVAVLNDCKVLICDTEMTDKLNQYRLGASIIDVNMWWLETGNWIKSKDLTDKVRKKLDKKEIQKRKNHVFHRKVANKPISEVLSIIRRWYYKFVGRGNSCMVIYDYVKITGESSNNLSLNEHQVIGDKINYLNDISSQIEAPVFVAMQLNRFAESGVDDSSAIALSDRLQWFSAFNAIWRRKTDKEVEAWGNNFGSHILKPIKQRFQGRDGRGFDDLVAIPEKLMVQNNMGKKSKYLSNFINYDVRNFKVIEKGTLKDIINSEKNKYIEENEEDLNDFLIV